MNSNNEETHQLKQNNKISEQNNINNINIADNNHTNLNNKIQIVDEKENLNEFENLKNINIEKEREKNDFFHDKEITEDSILYFSNKLKKYNKSYKKISYISILVYIIDIIIWFRNEKILHNFFNFFSIIILLISTFYQIYSFGHNFKEISREIYIFVYQNLYVYIIIFIINIINIIYILVSEILEIVKVKYFHENNLTETVSVFIYCLINIFIPSVYLFKLIYIKKGIKDLSAAKGEIYESDKLGDVEIIQSVINEI